MSLPIPLTVRIVNGNRDAFVTRRLRDLTFRSVVPGGFASATLSLDSPLNVPDTLLTYYSRVIVYDARSGDVAWEGRLEDPGRSVRADGQVWDIAAVGPSAHLQDVNKPLIYVDTHIDGLFRMNNVTPGATDGIGDDPGGNADCLIIQFPQGLTVTSVAPASRVVMVYRRLIESGQKLALVSFDWDAGITDNNFAVQTRAGTDAGFGSLDTVHDANWNTAGGSSGLQKIVTDWTAGRNTLDFRGSRIAGGAATIGDDLRWCSFRNVVIMATRYSQAGAELLTAADYAAATITPAQIVADLLGRLLPKFDGTNAVIDTGSAAVITELTYPDGVTADQVLQDLAAIEPGWYFAAWEANTAGLYRAEYQPWPSTVSYLADVADGYEAPGSADGLFNAVNVRWLDSTGRIRTTRRTQTVPELSAAGLTREGILDISDRSGTAADAQAQGDAWLADRLRPPNAGRLTIARRVWDQSLGRHVQPWNLRPGKLIRVRGIMPYIDALNTSDRDAVTIFRIVAVDFNASTGAATLELDTFAPTVARSLATFGRKRPQRR